MKASKEECEKAIAALDRAQSFTATGLRSARARKLVLDQFDVIRDFLDVAYRKLPSEKAFEAERKRRRASA